MEVYWLEQNEDAVPVENQWISAGEKFVLAGIRFPKRRNDWRLGRWTAKRALAACLHLPADLPALANIEIRAASSGAPEVFLLNQKASLTISLSHRAGMAMCAVAQGGTTVGSTSMGSISLGCDLETVEPRIATFAADYFTLNEQALVERTIAQDRSLLVTLLWSAKESALKALNAGLRLDTNSVEVSLLDALPLQVEDSPQQPYPEADARERWRPLQVCYSASQVFCGWWRHANQLVRTVVSSEPLQLPISLLDSSQSVANSSRRLPSESSRRMVMASSPEAWVEQLRQGS
ncbi:MAG: 4'-phosphopantetheinyl transferase family protein [Candidatus Sulfotelmatobacter sp.]